MSFTNNQKKTTNRGHLNGTDMFMPHDNLYDPLDLGVITRSSEIDMRSFSMNSKASFQQEEIMKAPENITYGFELMENEEISGDPTDFDTKQAAEATNKEIPCAIILCDFRRFV
ncbi:hypothetical protein FRX31_009605 [Thalictrum thalictroides]|uniref:Uncharacterized protein n=1 Tax=Thalictrum thalictroides TaxID=46969 RepID=A0A7J6WVP5_THATH|nr:hypothetical protein FRX31_009605 [Thalictrum thalictroides]